MGILKLIFEPHLHLFYGKSWIRILDYSKNLTIKGPVGTVSVKSSAASEWSLANFLFHASVLREKNYRKGTSKNHKELAKTFFPFFPLRKMSERTRAFWVEEPFMWRYQLYLLVLTTTSNYISILPSRKSVMYDINLASGDSLVGGTRSRIRKN